MTSEENIMKVEYFCPECGGTDVISQNWSMWNKEEQEWEITDPCEDRCLDCGEEIRKGLGKREIK